MTLGADEQEQEYEYDPSNNVKVTAALQQIQAKLEKERIKKSQASNDASAPHADAGTSESLTPPLTLRLHSIRQTYCVRLLTQFYNEHMIPHFPLEGERDALEDWIHCLDPDEIATHGDCARRGPLMDVLLLVSEQDEDECGNNETAPVIKNIHNQGDVDGLFIGNGPLIVAGIAFEYYQQAEVGLISYLSVHRKFRQMGIMTRLHPLAIQALEDLHINTQNKRQRERQVTQNGFSSVSSGIRAIFAETNTVDAGDVSEEETKERHQALFSLGYRLLDFPYVQPPLGTNQESFDDLMLLVYQGADAYSTAGTIVSNDILSDDKYSALRFVDGRIPSAFLHDYVVDFFMSVFGYDEIDGSMNDASITSFRNHWYYKLSAWFLKSNQYANIKEHLPWEDTTTSYRQIYEMDESKKKSPTVVAVIGAGAAGLSAAVQMAKNATSPLLVKLIEANEYVGGRIRTVITNGGVGQDVDANLARECMAFAPWPVPIGAEFVHGVGSVINDIIEEEEWHVEETFDFCIDEEYPSRNSFSVRPLTSSLTESQRKNGVVKVFGEGRCWNLKSLSSNGHNDYRSLIKKAQEVWDKIFDRVEQQKKGNVLIDMSVSSFVEQQMGRSSSNEEIEKVKHIIDAFYARTAASSSECYGSNEACREELNWDYTETNFRAEGCFSELIVHYMKEIGRINAGWEKGTNKGKVELIVSTPIVEIGSTELNKEMSSIMLSSRDGSRFFCDKAIVAVPLSILKAEKIQFCDRYSLPPEKKDAIEKINMFSGMKAHVLLRKGVDVRSSAFFEETDLLFCPSEIFVQVWLRRDEETVFVTGFVVADGRDRLLCKMKDEEQDSREIFLEQLQRIFQDDNGDSLFIYPIPQCSAYKLHDWSDDEFIMGLYSSPSVGAGWKSNGVETGRNDLKAPICESIYFAGEHTNTKTSASVQAAVESGLDAASNVMVSLSYESNRNMQC